MLERGSLTPGARGPLWRHIASSLAAGVELLMNEYRLNLGTQQAQEFLIQQMDNYFFGEGAQLPPDFVPPKAKG